MKIKDGKINFQCKAQNCKHSCCGPFDGISKELCSIDSRPFDEIVLTDEDYCTSAKTALPTAKNIGHRNRA
jgi:hypothetical protein